MKEEIIQTIKNLVGHEFLYFPTRLKIQVTPHTWPVIVWAACVSPDNRIYLMDCEENWFELCESDLNYDKVLPTLYQRIKATEKHYLKTAI